jgi:hypothetical protein
LNDLSLGVRGDGLLFVDTASDRQNPGTENLRLPTVSNAFAGDLRLSYGGRSRQRTDLLWRTRLQSITYAG